MNTTFVAPVVRMLELHYGMYGFRSNPFGDVIHDLCQNYWLLNASLQLGSAKRVQTSGWIYYRYFILAVTILIFLGHLLMGIGKKMILYYFINVYGTYPSE